MHSPTPGWIGRRPSAWARPCSGAATWLWLVWAVTGLGVTLGILAFVYGALNYHSLSAVLPVLQAL